MKKKFCTLLTFWPDFYYFHGDFWHSKNVDMYSFFWEGKGSQKVYGLYNHQNVDIYGWPLRLFHYIAIKIMAYLSEKSDIVI